MCNICCITVIGVLGCKTPNIETYSGHGLYVHYGYANLGYHAVAVTIKYCIPQIIFSIRRSGKT